MRTCMPPLAGWASARQAEEIPACVYRCIGPYPSAFAEGRMSKESQNDMSKESCLKNPRMTRPVGSSPESKACPYLPPPSSVVV